MDKSLRVALSMNLKERRASLDLSQADLAERADVSPGFIGEIETGNKFPSVEVLERLATSLEVPAYRLLMTADDFKREASRASFHQAYEFAMKFRSHIDEEIRELSDSFGQAEKTGD